MADELLRRNLERAFNPGSDFPSRLLLSRTMALVGSVSQEPRRRAKLAISFVQSTRRVVAAAVVLLVIVGAVGLFLSTRGSVPPSVASQSRPNPITTDICNTQCQVATQPAFRPKPGAINQCTDACVIQTPAFATPQLIWITKSFAGGDGPAFLSRTDDEGQHWRSLLSWDGPGAQQIRSSADGKEALVVTGWNSYGVATTFYTKDSGVHWTASGLPAGIDSDVVFFLNPREGWIFRADNHDLVHTTDAGSHWTLVARLDGMVAGGSLLFLTSLDGLYVLGSSVYATHDGGATWEGQTPLRPRGVPASAEVANSTIKFFNSHDGVLELDYCTVGCSSPWDYAYTTSDGGRQWARPLRLPTTEGNRNIFMFIDSTHWIGMSGRIFNAHGVIHTADAGQHWTVLLSPAPNSNMVAGPWDMIEHPEFIDPLHGWVISEPSLLLTNDGGLTWTATPLPG